MLALLGPSSRKRKRTGTGTSSTASSSTASRSRTKAMVGRARNSTQPVGVWPSWVRAQPGWPLAPAPLLALRTHKDHCGLSVLRDLLQQLQLMLGLGASDAGRRSRSRWLALGRREARAQLGHPAAACPRPTGSGSCSRWGGWTSPRQGRLLPLTSRSTSSRVSGTPPMRGSVTWGSLSAPWPW